MGFAIPSPSLYILGSGAFVGGGFYHVVYARYLDFGEHHRILGVALLAGSTYSAWLALRKKFRIPPTEKRPG